MWCGGLGFFSLNLPFLLFSFASLPLNFPLSFHCSVNILHPSWTVAKTSSSNAIIFQHCNVIPNFCCISSRNSNLTILSYYVKA